MLSTKQLRGLIDTHKARAHYERQEFDKFRSWYTSSWWGDDSELPQGAGAGIPVETDLHFETNYPYAFVDTMVANICPSNPKVTVNPRREEFSGPAKYREALINDLFHREDAHRTLWRASTMASIYPRSFVKTVWNFNKGSADYVVIDPRFVWFDLSAERWEDIRYLIEVTVLTRGDFNERIKKVNPETGEETGEYSREVAEKAQFGAYPSWLRDESRDQTMINEATKDVFEWVTVYEIYDFSGEGKFFHCLEDMDDPLFEGELPYRFNRNPFHKVAFNDNLRNSGGLSDVKLIQNALERLNELDTLMLWFAQTSIPITMINTGLVDNPEHIRTQIRDATTPGSIVEVAGKANASIADIIGSTNVPSLSPEFLEARDRAIQVIEFILGIPQYSRGVVGVSDVATEVALADTATRTRNGRRQKEVYDLIGAMAKNAVGLYEEFLPEDRVLPVRLMDTTETLDITRASMRAREILAARGEEPLDYDYEAVPYSPAENNRLVQLRNIQQFLPVLQQAQNVNQEKLIVKLADLLQISDVIVSKEDLQAQQQEAMAAQQQQAMAPGAAAAAPPMDTIASGALPPGSEPQQIPLPGGGGAGGGQSPLTGFGGAPFSLPPEITGK